MFRGTWNFNPLRGRYVNGGNCNRIRMAEVHTLDMFRFRIISSVLLVLYFRLGGRHRGLIIPPSTQHCKKESTR